MSDGKRPNVLLIVVHDLGTRLGCYGEESVRTPALDNLADEGVRFDRQFATACFCSPSRGSIITGK
ncbi:MAG: sulfatase-like hydrolase/transferase, partial [Armatimonadota bacterium]